jgi:hypothetical protein
VNISVTNIDLSGNEISDKGASALADALKVNNSMTSIGLANEIGDEGASALADALKVNTSVISIDLGLSLRAKVDKLLARNERLRQLFLFDARKMLLSVLCADECGALWPYVLDDDDKLTGVSLAADNIETLRAEFAAVVEERRRREHCRPVLVADFRVLQRQNAETSSHIAALNDIVSGQASQIAEHTSQNADQTKQIVEQTNQIAEQTNQIADLQRSTAGIVDKNQRMEEQNQQMHAQIQQIHALLMSHEQEPSANADEGGKGAAKRRRTGR